MCIPKANHKLLIDECYPPSKMLAGIGPEYKANSNELSRLAHYANRKPAKLTKVGSVLQQRAASEAKGVTGTGQSSDKAKGSLMVTLAIMRELITECHRELNYFTNSATAVIQSALQAAGRGGANESRDLEISARAASTFYAFAVHIDSTTASTDADTRQAYSKLLAQFSKLASERGGDSDAETKARLVGLGAIAGAISSDAFYNTAYSEQLPHVLPALLSNVDAKAYASDARSLQDEAHKVSESGMASNAQYAARRRNTAARSIPSFTFSPEKAVPYSDIASAAIGNLYAVLHYGDASHVQALVIVLVEYLNGKHGAPRQWENSDWCCWLAESICSWTALQYRFIVLTHLVEHLVEECEGPAQDKHFTLIAMITTLLNGKLSMIGLSTSDTANNLLGFAVRRVHLGKQDPLLGPLVTCISALATHVYYADQLNDMAEEICARIASLEAPEIRGGESEPPLAYTEREGARDSIRVLLACLIGLMQTSHKSSGEVHKGVEAKGPHSVTLVQAGTRSRISTSAWHQTPSLLASPDYLLRHAYEEALFTFFSSEVSPASTGESDPLSDSLGSKLSVEATGFTHSFSAALYVLVLSKILYAPTTVKDSPLEALPTIDRANNDEGRPMQSSEATAAALPIDFSGAIKIIEVMYERIPIASLLGTVPALLAINAGSTRLPSHRKEAVATLLSKALARIGALWGISQFRFGASSDHLPDFPSQSDSQPVLFSDRTFVESSKSPALDMSSVIDSLSNSGKVQSATGLDAKALKAWFGRDWSVQIAVDDSFVGASPFTMADEEAAGVSSSRFSSFPERTARLDSASGAGTASSDVGVDDFRQALGTRSYGSKANGTLNGDANGGAISESLEKKASRRVSRKISQPIKTNGVASVGGLLDSMKVGVAEEEATAKPTLPPNVA